MQQLQVPVNPIRRVKFLEAWLRTRAPIVRLEFIFFEYKLVVDLLNIREIEVGLGYEDRCLGGVYLSSSGQLVELHGPWRRAMAHIENLIRKNPIPDSFLGIPVNDVALNARHSSARKGLEAIHLFNW